MLTIDRNRTRREPGKTLEWIFRFDFEASHFHESISVSSPWNIKPGQETFQLLKQEKNDFTQTKTQWAIVNAGPCGIDRVCYWDLTGSPDDRADLELLWPWWLVNQKDEAWTWTEDFWQLHINTQRYMCVCCRCVWVWVWVCVCVCCVCVCVCVCVVCVCVCCVCTCLCYIVGT